MKRALGLRCHWMNHVESSFGLSRHSSGLPGKEPMQGASLAKRDPIALNNAEQKMFRIGFYYTMRFYTNVPVIFSKHHYRVLVFAPFPLFFGVCYS